MDAATIAAGLPRPRKSGDGWSACCPAHDDKNPSLSINDSDSGVLVRCHAGCSQDDVVTALKEKNLWPVTKSKKRIVAEYNYTDENGELLYQVVRYEPKDFRQRQPDGNGWQWNLQGVKRVLYNLPAVLKAERGVCVVEGEKDVESLGRLQITATTCAGGAEKWRDEYNAAFRGKKVYILPDNDDVGRSHANLVASKLFAIAETVKVVELPGLPEKGDVSDWIQAGGTRVQLGELITATPEWEMPPEPKAELLPPEPKPEPESSVVAAPEEDKEYRAVKKPGWRAYLVVDNNDKLRPNSPANAEVFLNYHEDVAGIFRKNEFSQIIEVSRKPPWDDGEKKLTYPRSLTDDDEFRAMTWLEIKGITVQGGIVHSAIKSVANRNSFHPVTSYLDGLKWDGVPRADMFLTNCAGAQDSDYVRAISRKFLISAIARIYSPGCKVDTVLILEGEQGEQKSAFLKVLFGKDFFTDSLENIGSKDSVLQIQGSWCVEIAELSELYRAEIRMLKAYISRQIDVFRPPYGRNTIRAPRHSVFTGTVNPEGQGYLRDSTGGRRFWPFAVGKIDIERTEAERDQIWAEAKHAFESGEQWWLTKEQEVLAKEEQAARFETDPWADSVLEFCDMRITVSIPQILNDCLKIDTSQQSQKTANRVAKILTAGGYKRVQRMENGKRQWRYERAK
jgi:predicted P-loop ATPase